MPLAISSQAIRPFLACALTLAASGGALANKPFKIREAQPWVRTVVPANDVGSPPTASGTSSSVILDDRQTKVSGASVERYYHFVRKVENSSGLDDLSQLRYYFEPSYQQLTIHYVRIQRGGATVNALRPAEIKIIQQEDELDQQLYNGSLAALIFLNDLRVGDVVDYAYTISGENPVLDGRFVDNIALAEFKPIKEFSFRLVFPGNRELAIKNHNTEQAPTKQSLGDDIEYLWYQRNVAPITSDGATPSWFDPFPRVSVSEFQSWADVVNWALPYYRLSPLNNPELRAKVAEWQSNSKTPEQRTVAALRFMQDEIRYLGIELGRYSHQPTQPEKVFARRFGDCKDKSLLLSSILNAMGIDAAPALVNTRSRSGIDSWQASPFAFDHVIVQATIDGKTYWLDPTVSYQRGGLDTYYNPPFERSLVLRAGTTQLERIPVTLESGSVDVLEVYDAEGAELPIRLIVTTTYKGSEADGMRYQLSTGSLADLSKSCVNFYANNTPSISADGLPAVEDDENSNILIVREKYLIGALWKDGRHRFLADKVYSELQKPLVSQRTTPLRVQYPVSLKQTILINLGAGYDFPNVNGDFADDALRFEYSYSKNGDQLRMECSLATFADSVSVDKVQQHLSVIDDALEVVGFELSRPHTAFVTRTSTPPSGGAFVFGAGVLVLPATIIFLIWWIRRGMKHRAPSQFAANLKPRPGGAPETALRFATREEVESALVNYNCRCGRHPYDPASPPKRERFAYDGQRLLGIRLLCPGCKQTSDLYINLLVDNETGVLENLSTS